MSLLAVILLPLLLVGLVLIPATRRIGLQLAPWAALPGLALALTAYDTYRIDIPWLMLGSRFGLDETGRIFLFFTALLWLAAGFYARSYLAKDPRQHIFTAFFLITLSGNLGLCLAQDAISFYFTFAIMTFAAYGLEVHEGDTGARRAGRVYLIMAVLGEALLIAGLMLLAGAAQTHFLPEITRAAAIKMPDFAYVMLFLGFGVKAGVPFLHMWLPLAHPVAPTPGSAVLSGAIIKAGLLGWLRFLPLGEAALPALGTVMLSMGLFAVFFGVVVGLAQRQPKTLLAYSSISQMGFMTLAVGAGLLIPQFWPVLLPAISLYALHHGLAKGALFLGVGVAQRFDRNGWIIAGLLLPALALAGAPLTSGALAKTELKAALMSLPSPWQELLTLTLPLAAVGTGLLMARFLLLTPHGSNQNDSVSLLPSWLAVLITVVSLAWTQADGAAIAATLSRQGLTSAALPVLAAALVAYAAWRLGRHSLDIPPGDMLVWLERVAAALYRISIPHSFESKSIFTTTLAAISRISSLEKALRYWPLVGGLWLLALVALAGALLLV